MASPLFEDAVEQATGMSIDVLRNTPIDEFRKAIEGKRGKPIQFFTEFPWIGRGNVLRDRCTSHEEAEAAYESAIRRLS